MSSSARVGDAVVGRALVGSIGEMLDSAAGADLIDAGLLVTLFLSETGFSGDTASTPAVVTVPEAATGTDSDGPINVSLSLADPWNAADALELRAELTVLDQHNFAPPPKAIVGQAIVGKSAAGIVSDSPDYFASLVAQLPVPDAASGFDILALLTPRDVSDAGAGADVLLPPLVVLALLDAGLSSEVLKREQTLRSPLRAVLVETRNRASLRESTTRVVLR